MGTAKGTTKGTYRSVERGGKGIPKAPVMDINYLKECFENEKTKYKKPHVGKPEKLNKYVINGKNYKAATKSEAIALSKEVK